LTTSFRCDLFRSSLSFDMIFPRFYCLPSLIHPWQDWCQGFPPAPHAPLRKGVSGGGDGVAGKGLISPVYVGKMQRRDSAQNPK
jgi:hypothetical protein